jgi:cell fate (sporulation/competence/biofilm development) regulator YlbF (YheA/YmcA/DUF963 family)
MAMVGGAADENPVPRGCHAFVSLRNRELAVASPGSAVYPSGMSLIAEESSVITKTRELCASIANDPHVVMLQGQVERFLNDDAARLQYQSVHERGEELHHKQHAGIQLGAAEIREFEAAREALFENEIARDFLSAQQELEKLQKEIGKYVSMTLELGRVPTEDDIAQSGGGCCNSGGCGCSH